jgi:hypothetical protein
MQFCRNLVFLRQVLTLYTPYEGDLLNIVAMYWKFFMKDSHLNNN